MNQDLHLLQKPFITVGAVFEDDVSVDEILHKGTDNAYQGFCYTFKAEVDNNLQVGDYAIVHANHALKIVKIVQVHDTPNIDINAKFEYKWVIQKIDFANFKQRLDEQKQLENLLNALQITERKNALVDRLNQASQKDKTFANLLNQIKQTLNIQTDKE